MSLVYSGFSPDCTFTSFTPMYQQAYGIIETLSPLHVGATAGEESGNLNLIFRDPLHANWDYPREFPARSLSGGNAFSGGPR